MLTLLYAAAAVAEPAERDPLVLLFVLAGVGGLLLFAYVASKLMGNPDPETHEEYPLPMDDFDEE